MATNDNPPRIPLDDRFEVWVLRTRYENVLGRIAANAEVILVSDGDRREAREVIAFADALVPLARAVQRNDLVVHGAEERAVVRCTEVCELFDVNGHGAKVRPPGKLRMPFQSSCGDLYETYIGGE